MPQKCGCDTFYLQCSTGYLAYGCRFFKIKFQKSKQDTKKCILKPQIEFKGTIKTGRIVSNSINDVADSKNRSVLLFFGGLDAHVSLIERISEKPVLFTLYGNEVDVTRRDFITTVDDKFSRMTKALSLRHVVCKSGFRKFLLETKKQTALVKKQTGLSYWFGFQHGIGLIGHAAPICMLPISERFILHLLLRQNTRIHVHPTLR